MKAIRKVLNILLVMLLFTGCAEKPQPVDAPTLTPIPLMPPEEVNLLDHNIYIGEWVMTEYIMVVGDPFYPQDENVGDKMIIRENSVWIDYLAEDMPCEGLFITPRADIESWDTYVALAETPMYTRWVIPELGLYYFDSTTRFQYAEIGYIIDENTLLRYKHATGWYVYKRVI
ncbi:MAG: hypothetical protein LBT12_00180 [Oscillospiraceae bacterium]|jgi:hypothetical protein|nr:hypothetical protein [Oscillospiraceae bacterium]